MLFKNLLEPTAIAFPDHEALVHKSERVTYQRLYRDACSLAAFLTNNGWVSSGDRVVLLMENCPDYVVSYWGILGAGGIVVPVNPKISFHELQDLILDSGATGLICQSSLRIASKPDKPKMEVDFLIVTGPMSDSMKTFTTQPISMNECLKTSWTHFTPVDRITDDIAQILYTSGTTGKPKGVMLSHGNLWANTESIATYLQLTSQDRVEVILPFYYSYGNSILLTHVRVGGTLVLSDQFVFLSKVLSQMNREKVTGISGVPSSYALLTTQSKFLDIPCDSLRYMTSAGGALSQTMTKQLRAAFPTIELYVMYGLTEASARLSYLPPDILEKKMGSVGRGMPGVNLQVLNERGERVSPGETGEIVAQGACVMKGYWNNPVETQKVLKHGKLYTGDLATLDEEGYIFILGRKDNMIKYGSYRIYPSQIEEVLNRYPGVKETAVLGMADEVMGEVIVAFVVKDKERDIHETAILQIAKHFLPAYKLPQKILFIDHLPKTSSGKIKYGDIIPTFGASLVS
ncbi:MAG: class I adenylate-forming enzyme family protein [Nitrospirae bacterium]|nr:class I adenylate-forming enzyme family protein [Nitrospirota bacterium]